MGCKFCTNSPPGGPDNLAAANPRWLFQFKNTNDLFTWTRTTAQHQDYSGNFPLMSLGARRAKFY